MRNNVEKVVEFDHVIKHKRSGIIENNPIRMVIEVDHQDHRIRFSSVDSCCYPNIKQLINYLISDIDIRSEISWATHEYIRSGHISISNEFAGYYPQMNYELWWQRGCHQYIHGEHWRYGSNIATDNRGNITANSSIFAENGIFSGDLVDLLRTIIVDIIDYENDINEYSSITRLLRDMDVSELKKNLDLDWVWKRKSWKYVCPVKHREISDSICGCLK